MSERGGRGDKMKRQPLFVVFALLLMGCAVAAEGQKDDVVSEKLVEVVTDDWSLKISDAWQFERTPGGVRASLPGSQLAIFIDNFRISGDYPVEDWASSSLQNIKQGLEEAAGSENEGVNNNFVYPVERQSLEGDVQYVEVDAFAAGSKFRIYTKFMRRNGAFVALSFHDYLCESYEQSVEQSEALLSGFEFKD